MTDLLASEIAEQRFHECEHAVRAHRQHPPPTPDDYSVWPTPWTVWQRRLDELVQAVIQADYDRTTDLDRRACIQRWNPWVR